MKVVQNGSIPVCELYLPMVKSTAIAFAKLCKKRNLAQNETSFSLPNAEVEISYCFGKVSIILTAVSSEQEIELVKEESEKIIPIWIKTFDEVVVGSFGGMFYGQYAVMLPSYSPAALQVNTVELDITSEADAELCCPYASLTSLTLQSLVAGFSLTNAIAYVQYYHNSGYYYTYSSTLDAIMKGFKSSAFTASGDGLIEYTYGGDYWNPEITPEISGSFPAPGTGQPVYICNFAWSSVYSRNAWGALPVGAVAAWPFESYLGAGVLPSTLWSGYAGIMSAYIHATIVAENLTFEMPAPSYYWTYVPPGAQGTQYTYEVWWKTYSKSTGTITMEISQICTDGTLQQSEIVMHDEATGILHLAKEITVGQVSITREEVYGPYDHYGEIRTAPMIDVYYWYHNGPYVPDTLTVAPRNYISATGTVGFSGNLVQFTIAFDDSTRTWKPCSRLSVGAALWTEDCHTFMTYRMTRYDGIYTAYFDIYSRVYDVLSDSFAYVIIFSYQSKPRVQSGSLMFGYYPVHTIFYPCNTVMSIKGTVDPAVDGVYRITPGSSVSQVHCYTATEMEPVYVSADGSVIATKSKIYGLGEVIDCTECCGVFLDHTHYVDMVQPDLFVIKEVTTGAVVDATVAGLYNFYELSEDSSACVISKCYKNPEDNTNARPAMVVDFADPVYRFELSDTVVLQYFPLALYQSNIENTVYGYPTGTPFGARYRGVCSCACYDAKVNATVRSHYIYCTPPGGFTFSGLSGGESECVLCNASKPNSYGSPAKLSPGNIRLTKTVVPQYHNAKDLRENTGYDGKRLNRYIYHHEAKILRRRTDGLTPLETCVVTETSYQRR